jgi:hypothetical protein
MIPCFGPRGLATKFINDILHVSGKLCRGSMALEFATTPNGGFAVRDRDRIFCTTQRVLEAFKGFVDVVVVGFGLVILVGVVRG